MSQKQKFWLQTFLGLSIVPVLFFCIPLTRNFVMDNYLYKSQEIYLFSLLSIETFTVTSLLIFNEKFSQNKLKHLISFMLLLIVIFLIFVFYTAYYMRNGISF